MDSLLKVAGKLDTLARTTGRLASWVIIPLIGVIMFDVITRKIDYTRLLFSDWSMQYGGVSVSTILQDMQWHFHAVLLMLTFGIGYLANAHVRVDIFRELLPRRKQAWVEMTGLVILALPFVALMVFEAWQLVSLAFHQGEGSESLTGIGKRWIIKSAVIIGFLILLAAIVATLFRLITLLFGSEAQQQIATDGLSIFADDAKELEAARLAAERALMTDDDLAPAVIERER